MALEIRIMNLGDVELDWGFLVWGHELGKRVVVPSYAYLILGAEKPILVDTGYRNPDVMQRLGMVGIQKEEQKIENQLAKYGLKTDDIGYVIHTHLHIDHAGQTYKFPNAVAVVQRREMEAAFSGTMGKQYNYEDMEHMFQRLHSPGSLWLLDGDKSGPIEVVPGVKCVFAQSHSPGSQFVYVETSEGTAVICGDTITILTCKHVIIGNKQVSTGLPETTIGTKSLKWPQLLAFATTRILSCQLTTMQ